MAEDDDVVDEALASHAALEAESAAPEGADPAAAGAQDEAGSPAESVDEGEMDGTASDEGEPDGTASGEGEADGMASDEGEMDGTEPDETDEEDEATRIARLLEEAVAATPVIDIGDDLRLIGTAHVSAASVAAVEHHIAEWQPDVVAVELCKSRLEALTSQRRLDQEALGRVLKEGKAPLVLAQSMLAAEQRRMGLDTGQQPGAEQLAAVRAAETAGLTVALVDRDIQLTLRRAWRQMGFGEKTRLIWSLVFDDEEDEEEAISIDDLLRDGDLVSHLMDQLRELVPSAGEVLVDERDEFIAARIEEARGGGRTLAILGAGHLEGVSKRLREGAERPAERLTALEHVAPRHPAWRVVGWSVPVLMIGLIAWLGWQGDWAQLRETAYWWIGINAGLSALGALLARGHPLAILTGALASPITSLNPTLAAGWFAGYVQLRVSQPTAEDLQAFVKLERFGLLWSNRAGRVLLVTALTNLGSVAGTWIAGAGILAALGF